MQHLCKKLFYLAEDMNLEARNISDKRQKGNNSGYIYIYIRIILRADGFLKGD